MSAMASQITGVSMICTTACSSADQRSKLRVTCLCEGNSPVTGEIALLRASNAKTVSVWRRHYEIYAASWVFNSNIPITTQWLICTTIVYLLPDVDFIILMGLFCEKLCCCSHPSVTLSTNSCYPYAPSQAVKLRFNCCNSFYIQWTAPSVNKTQCGLSDAFMHIDCRIYRASLWNINNITVTGWIVRHSHLTFIPWRL